MRQRDAPMVGSGNGARDHQPQPRTRNQPVPHIARPEEPREQPVPLLSRNTDTRIGHAELRGVRVAGQPDRHSTPVPAVLHRVGDEVVEDLAEAVRVGFEDQFVRQVEVDPQLSGFGRRSGRVGGGGDESGQVHLAQAQRGVAALQRRQVQQVVDDRGERARVAVHDLQHPGCVLVGRASSSSSE